mmetsp:Transcript_16340/g.28644  ORF Transcript_16340/g.28644 Transcript_16340/m.28644 type:complete len:237 (+) Transcript_16340:47-757(+)|eukprot:CAMPEP_0197661422 /NCGR_PEP_ID=MMETSP1338-20131121/51449_1 /TAXON_ID=43686 ORGANISM="Pelagodinium beii, Strain RCC1491" /NCGR_SAMPLE_ID=MMETSP1338 /ASSEMBLY_ACC=CAM_ASM_000754 /LENGTH=236 /DNA_ID=CAMNT_0043238975 /DNA_START=47 /DNA_END=757 /DNA_ORIENTATION=+
MTFNLPLLVILCTTVSAVRVGNEAHERAMNGPCGGSFKVVAYGNLGTALTKEGFQRAAPEPDKNTVVVDPAGMAYIKGDEDPEDAGGASGALYRRLGLDVSMPDNVTSGINKVLDAKYHEYDDFPVIHVVGPQLFRISDETEAIKQLATAYYNVLTEFVESGKTNMRLVPVSSGIFAGDFKNRMPSITHQSWTQAITRLNADQKAQVQRSSIELCIFEEREVESYTRAAEVNCGTA